MKITPRAFRIAAALTAVYLFWGCGYLAIRFAVETIPPLLMMAMQFLAAGAALYALALHLGAEPPSGVQWKVSAAVGALLFLGGNGALGWAQRRVPSGLASLLISLEPLWIVLMDWALFHKKRPRAGVFLGLVLGFAGIVALIAPWEGIAPVVDFWGAAALIIASFCWAAGSVVSRGPWLPESPWMSSAATMLCGGTMLLVCSVVAGETAGFNLAQVSPRSWLSLAYLILFGTFVGFSAFLWLLKHTSAAVASTYAFVNPMVALCAGWAFAGEPVTARMLISAAIIIPGVILITTFGDVEPEALP